MLHHRKGFLKEYADDCSTYYKDELFGVDPRREALVPVGNDRDSVLFLSKCLAVLIDPVPGSFPTSSRTSAALFLLLNVYLSEKRRFGYRR